MICKPYQVIVRCQEPGIEFDFILSLITQSLFHAGLALVMTLNCTGRSVVGLQFGISTVLGKGNTR